MIFILFMSNLRNYILTIPYIALVNDLLRAPACGFTFYPRIRTLLAEWQAGGTPVVLWS